MAKKISAPLERTARLLDLVPYISSHQGISLKDLAQIFRVDQGQMTSDLTTLWMCGLPGYTPLELMDLDFESGFVTIHNAETLSKPRSGIPGDPRNFRVSVHNPNPSGRCSPLRVRVQVEPPPGWDLGISQRSFEVRPESRREVTLTLTPPEPSPRETTQNFSVRVRHEDELVRPDSAVQGSYRIR
jgi:hypothetical protein